MASPFEERLGSPYYSTAVFLLALLVQRQSIELVPDKPRCFIVGVAENCFDLKVQDLQTNIIRCFILKY